MTVLTSDNLLLSRPKNDLNPAAARFAVDCKSTPERIADLVRESLAPNTRAAYLADLAHFENWGGRISTDNHPTSLPDYQITLLMTRANPGRLG